MSKKEVLSREQALARIYLLEEALKPFAAIADEYDADGLDEARPSWIRNGNSQFDANAELYGGRGGKSLLILADVLRARAVLSGEKYDIPQADPIVAKAKALYEASLPQLPWNGMSVDRRQVIIANYKKFFNE